MKKYSKLNIKLSLFFVVLVLLIAIGLGEIVYYISYNNSQTFCYERLERCGGYIERIIDADLIKGWLENGEDSDYREDLKEFEDLCAVFQLENLFVYRPCKDKNGNIEDEVIYIFDISSNGDGESYSLGMHAYSLPEFEEMKQAFTSGESNTTDKLKGINDRDLLTALVPLKLDSGEIYALAGLSIEMETVRALAARSSLLMVVVLEGIVILFAAILLWFIQRRVIRPIKKLSKKMDSFVTNGAVSAERYVPVIHTHDEIEQMTDNFNSMAESIMNYTADMKRMTAAQERLRAELDVAGGIRAAISADTSQPAFTEHTEFELSASLKNTVYNSCSFCNYFLTDEDHLHIVIGESVGKKLPSMLISMLAFNNICALARMGSEPYKTAYETNNALCGIDRKGADMTVSALIIEITLSTGVMKYVNAGMPPVVLKRAGEKYEAAQEEMQFNLGEMRGVAFRQNTVKLCQGNTVFVYSYGIPEMRNEGEEKFTDKRLLAEINDVASTDYPLREMIAELEKRLDLFRGEMEAELDTTILGFRYFG